MLDSDDAVDCKGDYDNEMGIGKPPEFTSLFEHSDILVFVWGPTTTTTYEKWVTPTERKTAKGVIEPGNVAAMRFTINGVYRGETRIQLEHVNRIGHDAAPEWPSGNQDDVYRVDIEETPSIFQEKAFRFTDGFRRDAAAAGCPATGCGR